MYKAIIFDFGGVFSTDVDIREFWQNNSGKLGVNPEEADSLSKSLWDEARLGKIDSMLFWERLGKLAGMSAADFKDYVLEKAEFRDEMYQYVREKLLGKYKLAILSNQIESWLEPILKEKRFDEMFDVIVTSYNTGLAKPDPEIYRKVVEFLGVEAEECIYVEDRPKNLEPAKALGMAVVEYKNYGQFIKELDQLLKE